MKYDFESYLDRGKIGSSKWLDMYNRNPETAGGVIPMSVADMDFAPIPEISEAICHFAKTQSLGYLRPTEAYLEAVLTFFRDYHNYHAQKEWIVTTPGIVPALATTVSAFTNKGDGVILFSPVYGPFYKVVEEQDRKVVECPLIYENNIYRIDFDLFEELASDPNVKLVLLCSPHNPGGTVWSKEDLAKIAETVEKNDLLIASDEIHSDIIFEGNEHTVFGSVNETIGERTILCTAASKTFNIAGLQCSNIFIQNEEIRNKFVAENSKMGIERANVLGFTATEAAYEKGLDWLKEAKQVIEKNNQILLDFFKQYGDLFQVMKPEASFTTWVNFKNLDIDHDEFMTFLDEKCQFFTTNGLFFGENGRFFMRINVGLPTKKLEENLGRLKTCLKETYQIG